MNRRCAAALSLTLAACAPATPAELPPSFAPHDDGRLLTADEASARAVPGRGERRSTARGLTESRTLGSTAWTPDGPRAPSPASPGAVESSAGAASWSRGPTYGYWGYGYGLGYGYAARGTNVGATPRTAPVSAAQTPPVAGDWPSPPSYGPRPMR